MSKTNGVQVDSHTLQALAALLAGQTSKSAKAQAPVVDRKTAYRNQVKRGFARKKIDVGAIDEATGKFADVLPYKEWLAQGWQVRKGEKSVRGLFHKSQCDEVTKQ